MDYLLVGYKQLILNIKQETLYTTFSNSLNLVSNLPVFATLMILMIKESRKIFNSMFQHTAAIIQSFAIYLLSWITSPVALFLLLHLLPAIKCDSDNTHLILSWRELHYRRAWPRRLLKPSRMRFSVHKKYWFSIKFNVDRVTGIL